MPPATVDARTPLAPLRFTTVYRAALTKWVHSPAMWILASVGFLPTMLFVVRALSPGGYFANLPPAPVEFLMVLGAAAFAAAVPLAPVVALVMAIAFWRAVRPLRPAR